MLVAIVSGTNRARGKEQHAITDSMPYQAVDARLRPLIIDSVMMNSYAPGQLISQFTQQMRGRPCGNAFVSMSPIPESVMKDITRGN